MNRISSTTLAGMQAAQTRLDTAASRIARAATQASATDPSTNTATGNVGLSDTLAEDLVQQRIAQRAFEANLAVFRTADAMAGTLLDERV